MMKKLGILTGAVLLSSGCMATISPHEGIVTSSYVIPVAEVLPAPRPHYVHIPRPHLPKPHYAPVIKRPMRQPGPRLSKGPMGPKPNGPQLSNGPMGPKGKQTGTKPGRGSRRF